MAPQEGIKTIRQNQIQFTVLLSYFLNKSESVSEKTVLLNKIDVIKNVKRLCYLNKFLRRKFLYLPYILKRFYLYDLKNGRTLTVVFTADVTNVSKFASTFFVVSNFKVLRQCSCGIYFPNQPVTTYRTHPWILLNFCILFFLVFLWLFC